MCLDIIVLVVIMYLILGGYKSSFCCQDNKEELGIVTTITSILFLDGVDYVLVTQTLVTYQVACKGKVHRLNGFKILYFGSILIDTGVIGNHYHGPLLLWFWPMYAQMGDFHVSRGPLTVISANYCSVGK